MQVRLDDGLKLAFAATSFAEDSAVQGPARGGAEGG